MLLTPIQQLSGIGSAANEQLQKHGIFTLWDLLLHLPINYEDRTQLTPLHRCRIGDMVQLEGVVSRLEVIQQTRRPMHLLHVRLDYGSISCRFLNYTKWSHTLPSVGQSVRLWGQLRQDLHGQPELLHPQLTRLNASSPTPLPDTLTAIYPALGGIKQGLLRKAIADGLQRLSQHSTPDDLPEQPLSLIDALKQIHWARPGEAQSLLSGHHPAVQRLALEELTAHHIFALQSRQLLQKSTAPALTDTHQYVDRLIDLLPYQLTSGQQSAWQQVQSDLQHAYPMHRLLQGDVGSGKTTIAALAACHAAGAGYQTSLMAPTEILAEQLFASIEPLLSPLGIRCQLLTGNSKAAAKRQAMIAIADGSVAVVIGTHALFQDQIRYAKLGLVIVDEQHRFGVEQRLALKAKGQADNLMPHLLLMTATPIPRTLAMSYYGDLAVSSIKDRPPGRQPIDTRVLPDLRREQVADRLAQACQKGAQAYWVSPFIEASEAIDAHNVTDTADWLRGRYPFLRIGVIHGQLPTKEKDRQMHAFKMGMLDLLVATTVIEVGVNVPNATLIVIDNSERYGLAQLHQLRGRVGRGNAQSHCLLLYRSPISDASQARLKALRDSQDGFLLAEQDLQLRGPGEILGTRQTGLSSWRIADLLRDTTLHAPAQALAQRLFDYHHERLKSLIDRWLGNRFHFSQV
jgi:ATP-dependent DNA helicase RecG